MDNKKTKSSNIFLPYYINKERLLDIYAVLNDGYAEYNEIKIGEQKTKERKKGIGLSLSGGFSLISIGGSVEGSSTNGINENNQMSQKKVQTLSSMIAFVLNDLYKKNVVTTDISELKEGDFAEIECTFSLNSISNVLEELKKVLNLSKGLKVDMTGINVKEIDAIKNMFTSYNTTEVVYEDVKYGVTSYLNLDNIYQSNIYDIISYKLTCLCQIKKVYSEGTSLLKYNIMSKLGDETKKNKFLDAIDKMVNNDVFSFDSNITREIADKPVYDVEIIAMYKKYK